MTKAKGRGFWNSVHASERRMIKNLQTAVSDRPPLPTHASPAQPDNVINIETARSPRSFAPIPVRKDDTEKIISRRRLITAVH